MDKRLYFKEQPTPVEKMRQAVEEVQEEVRQAEIAEGVEPSPQKPEPSPQVDDDVLNATEFLGSYTRMKTDDERLQLLEDYGFDLDDVEGMTGEELVQYVEGVEAKEAKQAAVGPQSVVGVAGITPTPTISGAESIQAELSKLMSSGRMTDPKVAKRVQELTAKLNQLDPPKVVT